MSEIQAPGFRVLMPVRGTRLARLLKLIALLRGPSSWNARKLSEHHNTSVRNVHRDIAVLKLAGVPVYRDADFGLGGSYRINREWYFPNVGLTDDEVLNLSVLTKAAETNGIPLLRSVAEVRDKLLSTLPTRQQDLIRDASELFEVLSIGMADHAHCSTIMTRLQQSLLTQHQIEASYYTPHGKRAKKLSLQPRRVFLANQCWYVAAYDNDSQTTKLYRLARFKSIHVTKAALAIKDDWSLKDQIGNAWTVFKGDRDWHIELEFAPAAAELIREVIWHPTQELETRPNGTLRFRATVSGLDEVVKWILSWGPQVTVRKPAELAAMVCASAKAVANIYETKSQ